MTLSLNVKRPQNFIRVSFSNRGFSKVFKSTRSLQEKTLDRNNIIDIGNILSDLKLDKEPPVETRSIPELVGLEYIGYVVEKERLNKVTGEWNRIDEYRIIGSEAVNFKDSRVTYSETYRYRIRSVIKLTLKRVRENTRNLELIEDVKRFEKNELIKSIKAKKSVIASVDRITNRGLSSKTSSGKSHTSFEFLKGFLLTATEGRTRLQKRKVTDVRSNVRALRRLKNLHTADLNFVKGTISRERLRKLINRNLRKFRNTEVDYVSRFYESDPNKNWLYVHIIESEPPPPPSAIKIIPNTPRGEMFISWLKPGNSQRDIKQFRVYHRHNLGEEWAVLATVPERDNILIKEFDFQRKHIFAITSIDAHGLESFLSMQIQAEFNENFINEKREKDLRFISGSGAKPEEVSLVLKKFLEPQESIVAKKRIAIAPTKEFAETSKNLIIRLTSLDTHEQKELRVRLENLNIRDDEE